MTVHPTDAVSADAMRDDRKSAALAAARVRPQDGARVVRTFSAAREILRSPAMRQTGVGPDEGQPELTHGSVFFLDGEQHRRRRTAIARFFTPKAIATRHRLVMEATADKLMAELRDNHGGRLDDISFSMAVAVAAEIVGLTESDQLAMSKHIAASLLGTRLHLQTGLRRPLAQAAISFYALRFFVRDVRPAIRARRARRRDDVISHLLDEGYPAKAILIECMTYAVAGMVTTREFIVMAAWHLFGDDALRARFVSGDEDDQLAILDEILRLEPVAAVLHRQADPEATASSGEMPAGELVAVSIRDANVDEAVVGACPFSLDPDRAKRQKIVGSYLSFGDGSHRCPGAQVALTESRIFLDRLMRVPGLRLARQPTMRWNEGLMSYELRDAMLVCD